MKLAFWNRIDYLLKAHKLKHREFAEQIGISYGTYRNWRYKNHYPDLFTAYEMAEFLGVKTEFLVHGSVRRYRTPITEQKEAADQAKILPFKQ